MRKQSIPGRLSPPTRPGYEANWCGYPACDDNQLHGKDLLLAKVPGPHRVEYGYEPADSDTVKNIKNDSNWSLSTPMTVTQAGLNFFYSSNCLHNVRAPGFTSLVPRLSPCANEKWKGKGRAW